MSKPSHIHFEPTIAHASRGIPSSGSLRAAAPVQALHAILMMATKDMSAASNRAQGLVHNRTEQKAIEDCHFDTILFLVLFELITTES